MADESEPKPRGLWDVMRQQGGSASSEGRAAERASSVAADEDTEQPQSGGKGLWELMGVASPPVPEVPQAEPGLEDQEAAPPPAWFRRKSENDLLAESESSTPAASDEVEEEDWTEEAAPEPEEEVELEADDPEEPYAEPPMPALAEPVPFFVTDSESPVAAKLANIEVKTGRSRGAMLSLLVGLFAVPLTLLAAMPDVWTRIPPALLGFGAP